MYSLQKPAPEKAGFFFDQKSGQGYSLQAVYFIVVIQNYVLHLNRIICRAQ
jgi:hypothetical protein